MGYYFGAYIEIEVKRIERQERYLTCKNGHRGSGKFCVQCGGAIEEKAKTVAEYPTWIDDIIGEEWIDVLSVITPPGLYATGAIIAIGNLDKPRGEWLYLDRWDQEIETKVFPTEEDVLQMTRELESNYEEVITALKNSPNVHVVNVKAGYVLCT